MSLPGHKIELGERKQSCCDHHYERYAFCECGWTSKMFEDNLRAAMLAHRVAALEDVIAALAPSRASRG